MEYVNGPKPDYDPVPSENALSTFGFLAYGYALLPPVSDDLLARLKTLAEANGEYDVVFNDGAAEAFWANKSEVWKGDGTRKQRALETENPAVQELMQHCKCVDPHDRLNLCDPVVLMSTPGGNDQDAHTDYEPPGRPAHIRRQPVAMVIALQDNTAFHVYPGKFCLHYQCAPPLADRVTVKLRAGTVFAFSGWLYHAGSSQAERNLRIHLYGDDSLFPREKNMTNFGEPQSDDQPIAKFEETRYTVGKQDSDGKWDGLCTVIARSTDNTECQVFDGNWKKGHMHGYGLYSFPSGAWYQGNFQGGKRHGKGKYSWSHGDEYDGDWKDDKLHGQGKMKYSDGTVYDGDWKDSKRHGAGLLIRKNGTRVEQEYDRGKLLREKVLSAADVEDGEADAEDDEVDGKQYSFDANPELFFQCQ
eukprot:m.296272 g.296272  ORF g.296272 m.296272 type:complete len:417 (+) comp22976_c0_seq14:236-1486(+)